MTATIENSSCTCGISVSVCSDLNIPPMPSSSIRFHCLLLFCPLGVLMLVRWGQELTKHADDTSEDVSSSIYDWSWPPIAMKEIAVQTTPSPGDSNVSSPVSFVGASEAFKDFLSESSDFQENAQGDRASVRVTPCPRKKESSH
ncbi:unnamed protein product [Dibothriocephalus latus]|uniref:Uncharacterized protein n=1 Tax=Dibothriocephalus latus TaxID=60516 RepID=A0A3P6Q6K0_DIBLA|nr:unnamed protein product [Dibothriocephalus latus]